MMLSQTILIFPLVRLPHFLGAIVFSMVRLVQPRPKLIAIDVKLAVPVNKSQTSNGGEDDSETQNKILATLATHPHYADLLTNLQTAGISFAEHIDLMAERCCGTPDKSQCGVYEGVICDHVGALNRRPSTFDD